MSKFAVLALVVATTVWQVEAQAGETKMEPFGPDWSIVTNQPCQVFNHGRGDLFEPFTWSGACVDGKASGKGTFTIDGGNMVYEGSMLAGRQRGHGTFTWADGSRYEGEFSDSRQHGQGIFIRADGSRYEGGFRKDMRHGKGISTSVDGKSKTCEWRDDEILDGTCVHH